MPHSAQIWAGSKQRELSASSMQLLQQYCPLSATLLAALVRASPRLQRQPLLQAFRKCMTMLHSGLVQVVVAEPLGLRHADRSADTLLGYPMTAAAGVAICLSAVLGLLVRVRDHVTGPCVCILHGVHAGMFRSSTHNSRSFNTAGQSKHISRHWGDVLLKLQCHWSCQGAACMCMHMCWTREASNCPCSCAGGH